MVKLRGRAAMRGKPLDEDCKKARISTHECGINDNRKFCLGLYDMMTDETLDKCKECKAFALNAEMIKD